MKKVILIILIVCLVVAIVFMLLTNKRTTDKEAVESTPTNPGVDISAQDVQSTTPVLARDFLAGDKTFKDQINEGHYQLGNFVDPNSDVPPDVPYSIEYIETTQFFSISLYDRPFSGSRFQAEQFLMQYLDLSETELCSLSYMVSVPNWIDPQLAGESLGFSFCPGSVSL